MKRFFSSHQRFLIIFSIFVLSAAVRIFYYYHFPGIWVQADTYGYYDVGREIMSGSFFKFFVNDERTPIYPIFLNLTTFFSGNFGVPILSNGFNTAMEKTILLQSMLGIFGMVLLYQTLRGAGIPFLASYIYTLFTSFNLLVFGWERILMAESLSTFWLVSLLFFIVKILKTEKTVYYFLLLPLFIIGFLIKPFYVFLPFFLTPFLCFRRTKKAILPGVIVLLGFYLSVWGYTVRNEAVFHYRGVNKVSEINMLGKILQFDLNLEGAKNESFFYNSVKEYRMKKGEPMPYRFLEVYDFYHKPELVAELGRFNYTVIKSNFPDYFFKSVRQIPEAVVDISELYVLRKPEENLLGFIFFKVAEVYQKMQYLNFIVFFSFFAAISLFLKQRNIKYVFLSILGVISLYQILFSVFLSYGEFGRLISPGLPIIFLFSFYSYDLIFKKMKALIVYKKKNIR